MICHQVTIFRSRLNWVYLHDDTTILAVGEDHEEAARKLHIYIIEIIDST